MTFEQAFTYWLNETNSSPALVYQSLFGYKGGGLSEFFTNWDSAREFTRDRTLASNPNLTPTERKELLQLEQQAYEQFSGQWLKSESGEIAEYYIFLADNVGDYTSDAGVINTFVFASGGSASVADALNVSLEEASEKAEEIATPTDEQKKAFNKGRNTLLLLAGAILAIQLVK